MSARRSRLVGAALAAGLVVLPWPSAAAAEDLLAVSRPSISGRSSVVAVLGADASPLRRLTTARRAGWSDGEPDWSPDGKRIAFRRTTDDWRSFHVYVIGARGGGLRRLTNGRFDETPSWSPDGRRIAFRSMPRIVTRGCTRGAIFIVAAGGGAPRLVPNTNGAGAPDWSPDGRRLAYERDGWIVVSAPDGSGRRRLGRGSAPAWSPDGRRLAFVAGSGLRQEIAVMDRDGTNRRMLTDNRFYDANPAWSPDGTRIAFDSARGNQHSTYLLDLPTGREQLLLRRALEAAWRPRA